MSPEQREEYDRQWSSWQLKYINPVEALFPDSNRPRDQHWFRILPGQQMEKLDMKDSIANVYLETMQYRAYGDNVQVQRNTHLVLNSNVELNKISGSNFCKINDFKNSSTFLKNWTIEFNKWGTYLFNYKMRYKGKSSSWIGSWFTIGRVGGDIEWLKDNFVKTTTPWLSYGIWNYASGSWVGNIKVWDQIYCYFTWGDMVGFDYKNLELIIDIIKIS